MVHSGVDYETNGIDGFGGEGWLTSAQVMEQVQGYMRTHISS